MHLPKTKTSEEEVKVELTEVMRLFRESRTRAKNQKEAVTNAAHYIVVTFKTNERQKAFLDAAGLNASIYFYVDGDELAKKMKIKLPDSAPLVGKKRRPLRAVPLIRDLPADK